MTAVPAPATACRGNVAQARAEMLAVLVDELDHSGVPYCLLSGYENFPDAADSDIDFIVHPAHVACVVPVLRAVARRCDAMLVQAFQHETGGWYFVLAKPIADGVAYLHPDCTTDYRRDGRLWLRADRVLAERCRLPAFFVPAAADEFLYYLAKKVLKQDFTARHLGRLRDLYTRSPRECTQRMGRFWLPKRTRSVVSALLENDIWRIRWHLPVLLAELLASPPIESLSARTAQRAREWRRRVSRATHPTGLSIAVRGGSSAQRADLATALERNLRPAFRGTLITGEAGAPHSLLRWKATVRSTLIIHYLASSSPDVRARNQICFDLCATPQNVESATRAVLQRLSGRLQNRLGG